MGPSLLRVLAGVSLRVEQGEFLAIIGSSGSGKSTLLHLLGALDRPDVGTIRYQGVDIFSMAEADRDALRNQAFGFVFQFYHLLPELNVLENVLLPQMTGSPVGAWFSSRREALARAKELLETAGAGGAAGAPAQPAVRRGAPAGGDCAGVDEPAGRIARR